MSIDIINSLKKNVKKLKKLVRPIFCKLGQYFPGIIAPGYENFSNGKEINTNQILHSSVEFTRFPPFYTGCLHENFFLDARGIARFSEETFFEILGDARVVGPHGAVISKYNRLNGRLSPEIGRQPEGHTLLSAIHIRKPVYLKGFGLLMTGPDASVNYFHWMTDALPKLAIAQKAGYEISNFDYLIVNNTDKLFQKESLAIIGISPDCIISLKHHPYVISKKLFAPSPTCLSGNVSPWITRFLKDLFSLWMTPANYSPAKIFVSRKHSGKRRILNETEISDFLHQQGYITVIPEELSLREQVILFHNAEHIIGGHGAGFTNIIFCKPGTTLIEFFPPGYVNQCYWTIASINQMKYGYVVGLGENITSKSNNHLIDSDFTVSIKSIYELQDNFK